MFLTLGLYIMPPDKVEVEPSFVVAVLICRAQAQGFMKNGERSTMKTNFPIADQIQEVQGTHKRQPTHQQQCLV